MIKTEPTQLTLPLFWNKAMVERELKDYLTFLAWVSKEMEEIYNEEINKQS
jgi:hypothetical protein